MNLLPARLRHGVGLLILLVSITVSARGDDAPLPPPPRFATSAAALQDLRESPAQAAARKQYIAAADRVLQQGVTVPRGPGDWIFYYANPENGQRLEPLSLTEHRDPKTGKIFTDERTVAAYRTVLHNQLNRDCVTLAWGFAASNDDRYASAVRDALLLLAQDYATYPKRRDRWGRTGWLAFLGGRRYSQSLSEAVGVYELAQAYDLVRTSSAWSDQQRQTVEQDFFRATADSLLWFNQGINNHQTWYNAGLMALANVLGDRALAQRVLTMKGGLYDQLDHSAGADGLWYEGAIAYHFYALQALMKIADAGRGLGLELHDDPRFRRLFDGPRAACWPDGSFPAINDSDPVKLTNYRSIYNWAAQRYDDPSYRDLLANLPTHSQSLDAAGLAILRQGQGAQAVSVMLDFGPHGGGHGHFDKLQLLLFARGREWLPDPGRLTYSHQQYQTWVKHTAAHNTIAINGRSQAPTAGKLNWLTQGAGFAACQVESRGAYAQTVLTRSVLLTEQFMVDQFEVQTKLPVQIDLLLRLQAAGVQQDWGDGEALAQVGERDGYPHLTHARQWNRTGVLRLTARSQDDQRLDLWLLDDPALRQVILCDSIGYQLTDVWPCVIRRVPAGVSSRFITVADLSGDGSAVQAVQGEDGAVVVKTSSGDRRITFDAQGAALH